VSYRIAQNKRLHIIAATVILPGVIDMIQRKFDEKCAQQLQNVPLSDNTVCQQIANTSED
jgi:hypothetical protein